MATDLQFLETRQRFLPVKQAALRARMLEDPRLSAQERSHLDKLFEMIAARFHFEFRENLERLKTLYEPFDPDHDTLLSDENPADEAWRREQFGKDLEQLLERANYVEMPREQVLDCVEYQAQSGLVVRACLADYSELRVFYRGIHREQRTFRPWLTPWNRATENAHVLSRVVLLVRLARHADQPVFLKLFKSVVAESLEMLLPYVRIRMRLVDHVKMGSSRLDRSRIATESPPRRRKRVICALFQPPATRAESAVARLTASRRRARNSACSPRTPPACG